MKWLNFAVGSALLIAAAVFTAVKFGAFEVQHLQQEVNRLEQEKQKLVDYAKRLSNSRRVAQVDVIRQRQDENHHTVSTLLWQEIGPDGTLGKPAAVEVVGTLVYFEAMVIKFDYQHIEEADPERGASLAMFRRIFGDQQAPESAPDLDRAARPPINDPSKPSRVQTELWTRFWELIDDPVLAERYGVRVVQCEAPAVPLKAGQIWELTLDAAGGLNLKKLGTHPATGDAPPRLGTGGSP
jgi:hypothetical protein